jgi:hypothetical protein
LRELPGDISSFLSSYTLFACQTSTRTKKKRYFSGRSVVHEPNRKKLYKRGLCCKWKKLDAKAQTCLGKTNLVKVKANRGVS